MEKQAGKLEGSKSDHHQQVYFIKVTQSDEKSPNINKRVLVKCSRKLRDSYMSQTV
jgi:hypothetical protein